VDKKYDVLYSHDLTDLIESVNHAMADGWEASGNLLIDIKGRYLQPIKRPTLRASVDRKLGPTVSFG
jgi:hypothetical protein